MTKGRSECFEIVESRKDVRENEENDKEEVKGEDVKEKVKVKNENEDDKETVKVKEGEEKEEVKNKDKVRAMMTSTQGAIAWEVHLKRMRRRTTLRLMTTSAILTSCQVCSEYLVFQVPF